MTYSKIENRITDRIISLFIPDVVGLTYLYVLIYVIFDEPFPIWAFISLTTLFIISHILILILIWPIYVVIDNDAITLIYRIRKDRKILLKDIVKIKISKWGFYVRYRKLNGINYIPLTIKTITAIKEEWEKWKKNT